MFVASEIAELWSCGRCGDATYRMHPSAAESHGSRSQRNHGVSITKCRVPGQEDTIWPCRQFAVRGHQRRGWCGTDVDDQHFDKTRQHNVSVLPHWHRWPKHFQEHSIEWVQTPRDTLIKTCEIGCYFTNVINHMVTTAKNVGLN